MDESWRESHESEITADQSIRLECLRIANVAFYYDTVCQEPKDLLRAANDLYLWVTNTSADE